MSVAAKVRQFEVLRAGSDECAILWPQVAGWIDAALREFPSLISLESLRLMVESGLCDLWIIRFGHELQAAFVTEIVRGANGAAVHIVALGGRGMDDWIATFSQAVESFAREKGCRYVVEMGRPGWARVLRPLGWVDGPLVMIRKVKEN